VRISTGKVLSVAALALLTAGTGPTARADDAAARRAIQGVYTRYARVMKSGDSKAAIRLLQTSATPDFTTRTMGGRVTTRPQMIQQLQARRGGVPKGGDVHMSLLTLKVNGNTATTTSSRKVSATQKDPQGKAHTFAVNSVSRDSWVKSGNAWKIRKSEEVKGTMLMDGKPFDPRAMMPRGGPGGRPGAPR
jgi:hypothetical protein